MQPYTDINGDSGIAAYEIGPGSIKVQFTDGGIYLYNASAPGASHVAEMQRLAPRGDGLNTYINKYVRKNFAGRVVVCRPRQMSWGRCGEFRNPPPLARLAGLAATVADAPGSPRRAVAASRDDS